MAKIGTDKGFETGVSTKFGQKRRRDSPVGRFDSTDHKRSPPEYTISGGSRGRGMLADWLEELEAFGGTAASHYHSRRLQDGRIGEL